MLFKIVPFRRILAERYPDNLEMAERYLQAARFRLRLCSPALYARMF
jgi:hypothetical protein